MSKLNYIFDVVGEKERPMRGFLDTKTQEIVIYDDSRGRELFRIGGQGQRGSQVQSTKSKLTTLTFVITNGSNTRKTATLFGSNIEPLIQPLGVSVVIREIENRVFNSHNYLRRDILSKKLKIVGLSYFVESTQQFNNDLQFGVINPYGVVETTPLSPSNYIDKYQAATRMMDLSNKFNWDVGARSVLYVPVEANSTVNLLFKVMEDVDDQIINEYPAEQRPDSFTETRMNCNTNSYNSISGGLGDVNFDGDADYEYKNSNNKKSNNEAIVSLIKFGILTTGIVLIVNVICKNLKNN